MTARNNFFKFIMKFKHFREEWISTGIGIFGGLGFLYSTFALAFIFSKEGIEMPLLFSYSMKAFGMWIAGAVIMFFVGMCLWAVYFNKKNWGKNKNAKEKNLHSGIFGYRKQQFSL